MNIDSLFTLLELLVFEVVNYAIILFLIYKIVRLAIKKERERE